MTEGTGRTVRLDAVEARFASGRVIGPVSVTIGPGLTHLVGPSGAGKSTLIRLICGEVRCGFGTVRVGGADPFADASVRASIGTLSTHPQLPGLFTVDEAWRWHAVVRGRPDWDGEALREALGLPGGLRLDRASAGERQRAELLAAVAGDPALLLLDEPFSHLDVTAAAILAGWLETWRARTVIITGHAALPMRVDRIWAPFDAAVP